MSTEPTKGRTEPVARVVPFTAGDGHPCNLIHLRAERPPHRGPVILVHGAGVRGNIFRAPVETSFAQYLLDHGYDVWLENWRASIDLPANEWTLDQAAVYDHPNAVKKVVEETGASQVKAVIHCQGSTSFTMSAMAGLVPQVKTIVSNAVSLHTAIPTVAAMKIHYAMPFVRLFTRYMNPQWGLSAPTLTAKALNLVVRLTHHECGNPVCKFASFTYGSGFPVLWRHENLNDETHEWLKQEFAAVPLTFFQQMARCVRRGNLVSDGKHRELPEDFAAQPPRTDARFAFFAGEKNRCFLPESQQRTFEFFDAREKGRHSLHVVPGYGHLDVFIGKNAANDVYPLMVQELDRD
jgi:pimeloyl-ACP methyl ester carboxylesterase